MSKSVMLRSDFYDNEDIIRLRESDGEIGVQLYLYLCTLSKYVQGDYYFCIDDSLMVDLCKFGDISEREVTDAIDDMVSIGLVIRDFSFAKIVSDWVIYKIPPTDVLRIVQEEREDDD